MYYPLLKHANNEMKAIRELKESSLSKVMPIIESKRIKKENITNWEATFNTLGTFLKERVKTKFIYDFNCAFEDLGESGELMSNDNDNLVTHCIKKMEAESLDFIPCFHHDSPDWLIKSVLNSGYSSVAIRVRCHDFQESLNPFIVQKLQSNLSDYNVKIILILDFFNQTTTLNRLRTTFNDFQAINYTNLIYLATSCPENASKAHANALTLVGSRVEYNNFITLKKSIPELEFGDYTTRLKGEIISGFNHNNSYIKIFYSTEDSYYIAKSDLIGDDGDETFPQVCNQLIEQDFFPGIDFSFGDLEIYKCAKGDLIISDHQSPIAIGVNHHIETTVNQINTTFQSSRDFSVS